MGIVPSIGNYRSDGKSACYLVLGIVSKGDGTKPTKTRDQSQNKYNRSADIGEDIYMKSIVSIMC